MRWRDALMMFANRDCLCGLEKSPRSVGQLFKIHRSLPLFVGADMVLHRSNTRFSQSRLRRLGEGLRGLLLQRLLLQVRLLPDDGVLRMGLVKASRARDGALVVDAPGPEFARVYVKAKAHVETQSDAVGLAASR